MRNPINIDLVTLPCHLCGSECVTVQAYGRTRKRAICAPCSIERERPCKICGIRFFPPRPLGNAFSYCGLCARKVSAANKKGQKYRGDGKKINCAWCLIEFMPRRADTVCCSKNCRQSIRERRISGKPDGHSPLASCVDCDLPCRPAYGRCRPCQDKHRNLTNKGKLKLRRERIAQSGDRDIHWRTVGERDNWVCHLCRGPVSPVAGTANQPWGATVDHLVPVIEGGEHRWHNVALAHRRCNISRGARPLAEVSA